MRPIGNRFHGLPPLCPIVAGLGRFPSQPYRVTCEVEANIAALFRQREGE
jgi:hypothetical protein